MKLKVGIIDYGIGNIFSVHRAVEVCGVDPVIIQNSSDLKFIDKIVLPGVGAFADGMRGLQERNLISGIQDSVSRGVPLLGICLGMQMLATTSEEFGHHQGLGLIPGKVLKIPDHSQDGSKLKIPFIGWNNLKIAHHNCSEWRGVLANKEVYFVHSYAFFPDFDEDAIAFHEYGGNQITAAVARGNIFGVQFHPEKSGQVGLDILSFFITNQ